MFRGAQSPHSNDVDRWIEVKTAISLGIGLFITIIGLVEPGFVRKPAAGSVPVELGVGGFVTGWPLLVFVVGLLAIIVMLVLRVRGAIGISPRRNHRLCRAALSHGRARHTWPRPGPGPGPEQGRWVRGKRPRGERRILSAGNELC